jgi:hypothetical protein
MHIQSAGNKDFSMTLSISETRNLQLSLLPIGNSPLLPLSLTTDNRQLPPFPPDTATDTDTSYPRPAAENNALRINSAGAGFPNQISKAKTPW